MSKKSQNSSSKASDALAPPSYEDLFGKSSSTPSAPASSSADSAQNAFARSSTSRHSTNEKSSSQQCVAPPLSTRPPEVTSRSNRPPSWQQEDEDNETQVWFAAVDEDNDGYITPEEARQALLNDNYTPFNADTINMILKLFDRNFDDVIDLREFRKLKKYVMEWRKVFNRYDVDRSGTIESNEIRQAFHGLGYEFKPEVCDTLCKRFSPRDRRGSRMNFDAFIYACAMIGALQREHEQNPRGSTLERRVLQWISQNG